MMRRPDRCLSSSGELCRRLFRVNKAVSYSNISDYGVIGNLETVALVGKDGSIDWYCYPYLDSPSVFGAILDDERGGRWSIAPVAPHKSRQRYFEHTNILITEFTTDEGRLELVDFMPVTSLNEAPEIIRSARCLDGRMELTIEIDPAFDYARAEVRVEGREAGPAFFHDGGGLALWASPPLSFQAGRATAVLQAGESIDLNLIDIDAVSPSAVDEALKETREYWESWVHKCESINCPLYGPWHELAVRSGLVLKLLTHRDSGSIAAAATTSLPESLEGGRNWDYRFAWMRDSVFTVQARLSLGYVREALQFLAWVVTLCKEAAPEDLAVFYRLHPETSTEEVVLDNLSGYRGIGPVRIGNAADGQRQLDIYGELMRGVALFIDHGGELEDEDWPVIVGIVDYVTEVWMEPDSGIWEMRGPDRHHVHSKVMCWAAVNEGIRLAERLYPDEPRLERWRRVRDEIHETVLARGLHPEKRAFVQYFGSTSADAATLLIPQTGFLPYEDERVVNTVQFVIDELGADGLIYRYIADDSLAGREGAFLACSFWLVDALIGTGRLNDAVGLFTEIIDNVNHLGLLSEELDPRTGELLGNFPQAFTHLALVNSAVTLTNALVERDGRSILTTFEHPTIS